MVDQLIVLGEREYALDAEHDDEVGQESAC